MTPRFFRTPAAFRRWLATNHARAEEVWVGFYKRHTGKGGLTYREALDEALCHGWIDGQVRRLDDERYMQRFTPRRPGSYWSAVNVKRAGELLNEGRMAPAGVSAFRNRRPSDETRYSFESRPQVLDPAFEKRFRAARNAWTFFQSQAPSYRRTAAFWVMSAKKPETRERRLAELIDASARGTRPRAFLVARSDRTPAR